MIYIYTLSDPETRAVRYVGKSISPSSRLIRHISESKSGRYNNHRVNWIKSLIGKGLEPKMDIIDEVDGEWEWVEEYWISQFKSWGFHLTNGTDGGDNPPKYEVKVDQYTLEGVFIKTWDSKRKGARGVGLEDCSGLALALSGKCFKAGGFRWAYHGEDLPNYERKVSNERKVDQYTLYGEFVRTWDSISEGVRGLGLKNSSGVRSVCLGDRFKAGGFRWAYHGEKLLDFKFKKRGSCKPISEATIKKAKEANQVKVDQYTLDGEFVRTWDSIIEATKSLKIKNMSGISAVCRLKKFKCSGFRWTYLNEKLRPYKLKIGRSVKQLDLDGNLIKIWNSTNEINSKLGFNRSVIIKACNGGLKTYKKYRWVWVEFK